MRVLAALLALAAQPALALSCLPPDPVRAYLEADASSERWGAVVGRLDFSEARLPVVDWERQQDVPPTTAIPAQLVGLSLGPNGWKKPFQGNVSLVVECWGPWCAAPATAQRYLVFIKREATRHVAYADPCGTKLFANPDQDDLDRLTTCFRGGPCAPQDGIPD